MPHLRINENLLCRHERLAIPSSQNKLHSFIKAGDRQRTEILTQNHMSSSQSHTRTHTNSCSKQSSPTQAIIPSIPERASKPRWRLCVWEECGYLPPQTSPAFTSFSQKEREEEAERKKWDGGMTSLYLGSLLSLPENAPCLHPNSGANAPRHND